MKYISLPSGHQVKVDDEDFARVSRFKWHRANGYAMRHVTSKPDVREYMHRFINNTPKGLVTDHINGDKLDNRKANLRTATVAQNGWNAGKWNKGVTKFRGVSLHKVSGLWRARITVNKKDLSLGYFKTEAEAVIAYEQAAKEMYGEFGRARI